MVVAIPLVHSILATMKCIENFVYLLLLLILLLGYVIRAKAVFLKVGGIAPLGSILNGKGRKKQRGR